MSKVLKREEILALARLSKIRLTESEITQYQKELSSIIEYFKILSDVDIEGLEPTSQVTGLVNVMREDIVKVQVATPDVLMARAPKSKNGYIQVGRMI